MSEPLDTVASRPRALRRLRARALAVLRDGLDQVTVRAHALALRFDWVPDAFDSRGAVSPVDPVAIRRGWMRQLRRWRTYSPEEVFAWKAGVALLVAVIGVLALAVGALR